MYKRQSQMLSAYIVTAHNNGENKYTNSNKYTKKLLIIKIYSLLTSDKMIMKLHKMNFFY